MSTLRRENGIPAPQGGAPTPRVARPIQVPTDRIIVLGMGAWLLALAIILLVPSLHRADRAWWPWVCVTGLVLGALGYLYVRRGRGNAASAHQAGSESVPAENEPADSQSYY